MRYRPDVDGLRAIAVATVVLYHAGFAAFQGGFVGVDVFFVISGFLITGLIRSELEAGRFRIRSFYERRVRRIFPALFATMSVVALAAWLLLPPAEFTPVAQSVAAAGASVSNIQFALQANYFGAPAETQPLLHTWSLGVEEQFYLAFPALMLLAWRFARGRLRLLLWAATVLSFAACELALRRWPTAAFYLTPFRAWELGLGALAATGALPFPASRGRAEAMVVAGLLLVLASACLISPDAPFPGVLALPPCLGALLVVLGGQSDQARTHGLLSWRPLVFVGLVSYSLYLWHWPILVFARAYLQRPLSAGEACAAIAVSVALAVLSWRFVETPFRRAPAVEPGAMRPSPLRAAVLAVVAALAFGLAAEPIQDWLRPQVLAQRPHIRGREDYRDRKCFLFTDQGFADWQGAGRCAIGGKGPARVLLWGDSFAAHYAGGLDALAGTMPSAMVLLSSQSCPPVLGVSLPSVPSCAPFNEHLGEVLDAGRYDTVVLAARWERYWGRQLDGAALERTIALLHARGLRVVLVGQGPSFAFNDPVAHLARTEQDAVALPAHVERINRELRQLRGVDVFFDPARVLCRDGRCPIREHGQFLYWDSGHYARAGSEIAARGLVSAVRLAREQDSADGNPADGRGKP